MTAQSLRLGATSVVGLGLAGVLWFAFSGPFSLSEFCTRNRPTWVFGLFDTPSQVDEATKVAASWVTSSGLESAFPNAPKITTGKVIKHETGVAAA